MAGYCNHILYTQLCRMCTVFLVVDSVHLGAEVLRFDIGIFSFPRVKAGSLLELAADGQRPAVHQDEIHVRPLEDPSHQAEEGVDNAWYTVVVVSALYIGGAPF